MGCEMYPLADLQLDNIWHQKDFNVKKKQQEIMAEMPDYDLYLANKKKIPKKGRYRFMNIEPLLTREQEYHLFRKYNYLKYQYKKGKFPSCLSKIKELRDIIVCANTRLVIRVVKTMKFKDYDTAISDGYYGLIYAVDLFDFRKGFKFITYAYWSVKTNIQRFSKIDFKEEKLIPSNQYEVLADSVSKEDNEVIHHEAQAIVQDKMKFLSDREKKVIIYYFGLDRCGRRSIREVSEKLKINPYRIEQMKDAALRKIRGELNGTQEQDCLSSYC